jgi:hypothetical protein
VNELIQKSCLSAAQQRLLEIMQTLNFGRIEDLEVRGGEPVFSPAPRLIKDIRLGGVNSPRPETDAGEFCLKHRVIEIFDHLRQLGDGTIQTIEVKHGLPTRLLVEHGA